MTLSRRVARVGVALDRVPLPAPEGDPLPDELASYAQDLSDAYDAWCTAHGLQPIGDAHYPVASADPDADHECLAQAVGAALRRLAVAALALGEPRWLCRIDTHPVRQQPADDRPSVAVAAGVEPESEIPEPIADVPQVIDNRRAMREALGRPSREHRRWSEVMQRRYGRTL